MGQILDIVVSPFVPMDATHGVGEVQKIYMDSNILSSCPFIVAFAIGLNVEVEYVNTNGDHKTEKGEDYLRLNPKGRVPAMKLKSGNMITEIPMMLMSLCDQVDGAGGGLSYPVGTFERVYLLELLCWIEGLHVNVNALYDSKVNSNPMLKDYFVSKIQDDLIYFDRHVLQTKDKKYIQPHLTIADIYFYTIYKSTYPFNLSKINEYCPLLQGYMKRLHLLPKVVGAETLMTQIAKEKPQTSRLASSSVQGAGSALPQTSSSSQSKGFLRSGGSIPPQQSIQQQQQSREGSTRPASRRVSMTQVPDLQF